MDARTLDHRHTGPSGLNFSPLTPTDQSARQWLACLPPLESLLVRNALEVRAPLTQLSRLGVAARSTLTKRWASLRRRLRDPHFHLRVRAVAQLPRELRPLARDHLLAGLPLRACALHYGLTLAQVRTRITRARRELKTRELKLLLNQPR